MYFLYPEKVFLQSCSGGVLHAFSIRARSDHSSSAIVTSLMAFKLLLRVCPIQLKFV
jgi:hypothetical protein